MIEFEYKCTECNKPTDRDLLIVKKVSFLEMGENPACLKTRTESWLCPDCCAKDRAYKIPKGWSPRKINRV